MEVITPKQQQRRLNELQRPDIDRLMKQANKEPKGGKSSHTLLRRYGIEGNFDFTANEWGTGPRGEQ